jgi:quercetin dioxygenase-like cupin family protein
LTRLRCFTKPPCATTGRDGHACYFCFGALAELPWERVTDKIQRRVLAGQQGMIVWWKMKAGAHAATHQHPHEQIVWMLKGKMDFRIGNDRRSMVAGDVAVIPGNVEHEGSSGSTSPFTEMDVMRLVKMVWVPYSSDLSSLFAANDGGPGHLAFSHRGISQ